jgi:hypothetical protein
MKSMGAAALAAIALTSAASNAEAAKLFTGTVAGDFGLVFYLDETRPTKITLNIDASQLNESWLERLASERFAVAYEFDANGVPQAVYEEELGTTFSSSWTLDSTQIQFEFVLDDRGGRGCNPLAPPYKICRYFDRDRVEFGGVTNGGLPLAYSYSIAAVPEPAIWAMLIIGFSAVGTTVRASRRRDLSAQI